MSTTKIPNELLSSGVGTGASNLVELDSSGKLPAVDGSNLTGIVHGVDGIVSTANATAITIDSNENVGIGGAPVSGKQLTITSNGVEGLEFQAGTGFTSTQSYNRTTNAQVDQYLYASDFFFYTGDSGTARRMTISNTGNVEVSTGNLVIGTAGKGIDFSAQTSTTATGASASSGGEILDHYEEGTWSPTLSSSTGTEINRAYSSTPIGTYIRVGRLVTCTFQISCNVTGINGTGEAVIKGIPFTPDTYASGNFGRATSFAYANNDVSLSLEPNNVKVYLMKSGSDSTSPLTYFAPSSWGTPFVTGTLTYTTA